MLDKKNIKILNQLNKLCDNTYKVFEKTELKGIFGSANIEQTIQFFKERQLIDVKYDDENVVCLSVLPKATVELSEKQESDFYNKKLVKIMIFTCVICAVSAFIGSFLANLIIR